MIKATEPKLTPQETVKKLCQKRLALSYEQRQVRKASENGNTIALAAAKKHSEQLKMEINKLNSQIEEYRRAATPLYRFRGKAISQNFMTI